MSSAVSGAARAAGPLRRESFARTASVLAFRVAAPKCSQAVKAFRGSLFKAPRVKPVVALDDGARLVRLAEGVRADDLSPEQRALLDELGAQLAQESVELGYANMSAEEVLRQLLPDAKELPSSFETVGHVAHLNLRDDLLPHRHLIGQVLLDKNPRLRTVVNKVGTIQTEFRTFPMELLAGEDDLDVEVSESGCRFRFNFRDVYWNSRLHTEHLRVIDAMRRDDVVCDMFCGVGPFAVPAAKRGILVYANDLNPASHRCLVENARLNKCEPRLRASNLDARAFVRKLDADGVRYTRVVMNLPAAAIEFLDVFRDWDKPWNAPTVHCYCFASPESFEADIRERCAAALGAPLPADTDFRDVRDVAPQKHMYCVTFSLPRAAAGAAGEAAAGAAAAEASPPDANAPATKRARR